MPDPTRNPITELDDRSWTSLSDTVRRFEQAWRKSPSPDLADFAPPAEDQLRLPALVELVKVDQEYQWESANHKRLEEYLDRWPELAASPELVIELVRGECLTRAVLDELPSRDELRSRFPTLCDQIDLKAIEAEASADRSRVRPRASTAPISDDATQGHFDTKEEISGPHLLKAGQPFGRYQIRAVLGQGAMGVVYRAYDPKLDREVALKIPQFSDPNMIKRFVSEARAAARIRHPNVCPIYDVDSLGGTYYLTMALIDGRSLDDWTLPINPGQAARWVQKLADALDSLHSHGVVHRDIKPSNVMIDSSGEPLLMDFGLARTLTSDATLTWVAAAQSAPVAEAHPSRSGSISGTPVYMSPEQAKGRPADGRSDVYSLGVLLYVLLTGRTPFSGPIEQLLVHIAETAPPLPRSLQADLPAELETICLKAMAKDPADRYQSAGELASALKTYVESASTSRPKDHIGRRPKHAAGERRLHPWRGPTVMVLGLAFVLAVSAGVTIYLKTPRGVTRVVVPNGATVRIDGDTIVTQLNPLAKAPTITRPDGEDDVLLLAQVPRWITLPGRAQQGACVAPDGGTAFVALDRGQPALFQKIHLPSGKLLDAINFALPPDIPEDQDHRHMRHEHKCAAVSADGRYLYTANYYSMFLARVDLNVVPSPAARVPSRQRTVPRQRRTGAGGEGKVSPHQFPLPHHQFFLPSAASLAAGELVMAVLTPSHPPPLHGSRQPIDDRYATAAEGRELKPRRNRIGYGSRFQNTMSRSTVQLPRVSVKGSSGPAIRPHPVQHLRLPSHWSASIAIAPNQKLLLVTSGQDGRPQDLNNDYLTVIDVENDRFAILGHVQLEGEPIDPNIAISADSRYAYVVTQRRSSAQPALYEIQLTTPIQVTRRLAFPDGSPSGVAISSKHKQIFVSDSSQHKIWMVDMEQFQLRSQVDLFGRAPGALAIKRTDKRTEDLLLALCPESRALFCVDPATGQLVGGATGLEPGAFEPKFAGDHVLVMHLAPSKQLAVFRVSHLLDRIVFASNREGGSYRLYAMAMDGQALLRLTNGSSTNRSPRWSPDGHRIAFISNRAGPDRICVTNRDGTSLRVFDETDPVLGIEGDASLDWSPDSCEIAFIGDQHRAIRIVDVETGQIRTFVSGHVAENYGYHNGLSWDRTENRILFNSQDPVWSRTQDIFVLDPQTLKVDQLTKDGTGPAYWLSPAASPDARTIAAIHEQSAKVGTRIIRNIFLLDRSGQVIRQLTRTEGTPHANPRWFPDGHRLLYSAGPEGHNQLYWLRVDDTNATQLTGGDWDDVEPDIWGPP